VKVIRSIEGHPHHAEFWWAMERRYKLACGVVDVNLILLRIL